MQTLVSPLKKYPLSYLLIATPLLATMLTPGILRAFNIIVRFNTQLSARVCIYI